MHFDTLSFARSSGARSVNRECAAPALVSWKHESMLNTAPRHVPFRRLQKTSSQRSRKYSFVYYRVLLGHFLVGLTFPSASAFLRGSWKEGLEQRDLKIVKFASYSSRPRFFDSCRVGIDAIRSRLRNIDEYRRKLVESTPKDRPSTLFIRNWPLCCDMWMRASGISSLLGVCRLRIANTMRWFCRGIEKSGSLTNIR